MGQIRLPCCKHQPSWIHNSRYRNDNFCTHRNKRFMCLSEKRRVLVNSVLNGSAVEFMTHSFRPFNFILIYKKGNPRQHAEQMQMSTYTGSMLISCTYWSSSGWTRTGTYSPSCVFRSPQVYITVTTFGDKTCRSRISACMTHRCVIDHQDKWVAASLATPAS